MIREHTMTLHEMKKENLWYFEDQMEYINAIKIVSL